MKEEEEKALHRCQEKEKENQLLREKAKLEREMKKKEMMERIQQRKAESALLPKQNTMESSVSRRSENASTAHEKHEIIEDLGSVEEEQEDTEEDVFRAYKSVGRTKIHVK